MQWSMTAPTLLLASLWKATLEIRAVRSHGKDCRSIRNIFVLPAHLPRLLDTAYSKTCLCVRAYDLSYIPRAFLGCSCVFPHLLKKKSKGFCKQLSNSRHYLLLCHYHKVGKAEESENKSCIAQLVGAEHCVGD